jgi:tRNA(adenine34) deaminase
MNFDIAFMRIALEEGHKGLKNPNGGEVGALIVKGSEVVYCGFNEGEIRCDPTAHAEMVVIRGACAKLKTARLDGCTLYCTLQPCGMCTMACLWAGISRIVYGAGRQKVNAVYFETRHLNTEDFIEDAFRNDLSVKGGVLAEECEALYANKHDTVDLSVDAAHKDTKGSQGTK